jgi:hypothetical protein
MKTSNLLAIACASALTQGTVSFAPGGGAFTTRKVSQKRILKSSLSLTASNLFASPFPSQRSVSHDDPLVNNRYSASDWLHNVFTLPRSSVLKDIRNPVVTIAVWSTLVSVIHRLISKSSNKILQKFAGDMCIGGAPHSFLVSSLGLLLVFRTNSAYQRFNVSATYLCCFESIYPYTHPTAHYYSLSLYRRAASFGKISSPYHAAFQE